MLRWIFGIDRVRAAIESKCLAGDAIEETVEVGRANRGRGGTPATPVVFMLSVLLDVPIHRRHVLDSCREVAGRVALLHRKEHRQNSKQDGQ